MWNVVTRFDDDGVWRSIWQHDSGRIVVRSGETPEAAREAARLACLEPVPVPLQETVSDASLGA